MLNVVLDTNIILASISRKSPYHLVFEALDEGLYRLYISNEILLEYEEKITSKFDKKLAEIIISALLLKSNVEKTESFFDLNLIKEDVDDNKFVNCAFSSNVNYLVSNDKHFNILKEIDFPKINLIKMDEFIQILNQIKTDQLIP